MFKGHICKNSCAYSYSYIVLMSNCVCAFQREARLKYYIAICNQ